MAEYEVYSKSLICKRKGSPYWYVRFRRDGVTHFKSLRTTDKAVATQRAGKLYRAATGEIPTTWESHLDDVAQDSKSWFRVTLRKARYRHKGMGARITQSDLHEIALRSGGRCELTGIPFSEDNPTHSNTPPFKPSLDRIDSRLGYTKDNCRLVCASVNIALRDWGEDVFTAICAGFVTRKVGTWRDAIGANSVTPLATVQEYT